MFGTNIESEPCNTNRYKEPRSEPTEVKISPWVGMMELKDEVDDLNDNYAQKVVELIDIGEILESSRELIETSDTERDTGMKLIDCKDISVNTYFSEPEPELDLIDFRDFSLCIFLVETERWNSDRESRQDGMRKELRHLLRAKPG